MKEIKGRGRGSVGVQCESDILGQMVGDEGGARQCLRGRSQQGLGELVRVSLSLGGPGC